jgi:site-specific DNA-methyltransferase (adenine-specific)
MPKSMPIFGRMSPSHYGLLYYSKGKPATFNIIRQPVQTCRHCGGEVKDYGGHRNKLHDDGLRLQDVFDAPEEVWEDAPFALPAGEGWSRVDEIWEDIPPVRHARYKHRDANALAPLMLERLVAMTTNAGDIVVDPFCGTGTTPYAAEHLGRRWLSAELGDIQPAIQRLEDHAAGLHARWESARGKGRTNGKAAKKAALARKKRELLAEEAPELPFDARVAG